MRKSWHGRRENFCRASRFGPVAWSHRLGERHEHLGLLRGKPPQKPHDECQMRSVQRKCAVFCASLMLDWRFTRGIMWNFDSRRLHFKATLRFVVTWLFSCTEEVGDGRTSIRHGEYFSFSGSDSRSGPGREETIGQC